MSSFPEGYSQKERFPTPDCTRGFATRHRRRPFRLVYHTYSSKRSAPGFPDLAGFPDLVLVHPQSGRTIFAELKKEGSYPTPVASAPGLSTRLM